MDELVIENISLKLQNVRLKRQLRRYRKSLRSALNILDPDQLNIIKHDLIHSEKQEEDQYAQSKF